MEPGVFQCAGHIPLSGLRRLHCRLFRGSHPYQSGFNAGFFFCKLDAASGINPAEQILMYKDEINETTETFSIP